MAALPKQIIGTNFRFWKHLVYSINHTTTQAELIEVMEELFTVKLKNREIRFRYGFTEEGMVVIFNGGGAVLLVEMDTSEILKMN